MSAVNQDRHKLKEIPEVTSSIASVRMYYRNAKVALSDGVD